MVSIVVLVTVGVVYVVVVFDGVLLSFFGCRYC